MWYSKLAMIEFRTMGRGIALQFKNEYPANFKVYEAARRRKAVQPGRMFVFETGALTNPKFIINFPTKRHWRGNSRMEDIYSGLKALVDEIHGIGRLDQPRYNEIPPRRCRPRRNRGGELGQTASDAESCHRPSCRRR
jgi:Macro domain